VTTLRERLKRYCDVEAIPFRGEAVPYKNRTPAHEFVTVLMPLVINDLFVFMTARDSFDASLCNSLLDFVKSREGEVASANPFTVLDGVRDERFGFAALAVASPACHHMYETQDAWLHDHAIEVFPVHRCEFSGKETLEQIDIVRHYGPTTIDWAREAVPLVLMKWENLRNGSSSHAETLYVSEGFAVNELENLESDARSHVEIQNFRRVSCRVERSATEFAVAVPGHPHAIRFNAFHVRSWLAKFLREGEVCMDEIEQRVSHPNGPSPKPGRS